MENDTLLSVIIPCFNCEKYIDECVVSLRLEEARDIQVILVNDGSTDRTFEKCVELSKKYPNIDVVHTENKGVSCARNVGLDYASGIWLMFVDSDDFLEQGYINILRQHKDRNTQCIRFGINCRYVDENNKVIKNEKRLFASFENNNLNFTDRNISQDFMLLFQEGAFDSACGVFYKNDIIQSKKIRFNESMAVREDSLFLLTYAEHIDSIRIVNQYLYNYRIVGNQTYHYRRPIPLDNVKMLNIKYLDFIKMKGINEPLVNQAIDHHIFQTLIAGIIHYAAKSNSKPLVCLFYYIKNAVREFSGLLHELRYRNMFYKTLIYMMKHRWGIVVTIVCKIRYMNL